MIHLVFILVIGAAIANISFQCVYGVVVARRLSQRDPSPQALIPWLRAQTRAWGGVAYQVILLSLLILAVVVNVLPFSPQFVGWSIWLIASYGLAMMFTLNLGIVLLFRSAMRRRGVARSEFPRFPGVGFSVTILTYGTFFAISGVLYIRDLYSWNWTLVALATIWSLISRFLTPHLNHFTLHAIPLTATPWAVLAPRITQLEQLAGRHFAEVRVVHAPWPWAISAAVVNWPRPTLILGETLLQQTDWRQRDAIISHELSHLHARRIPQMFIANLVYTALLASLYILLLPQPNAWNHIILLYIGLFAFLVASFRYRALLHRIEFACDADGARFTGDPTAMIVALATLNTLRGGDVTRATITHPSIQKRWERLSNSPATAPWAQMPVASAEPQVDTKGNVFTQPLVPEMPPAPLPTAPWGTLPADAPERHAAQAFITASQAVE